MKTGSILSLLALVFVGFGCTSRPTVEPAPVVPVSETMASPKPFVRHPLDADDESSIAFNVTHNTPLNSVSREKWWVVPDGIDPMQMTHGASSATDDQTLFAFVEQPNQSNPLWLASGTSLFGRPGQDAYTAVQFAGVLFSRDSGLTWRTAFSIPPVSPTGRMEGDLPPFNPVGMFTEKGRLWLDVMDGAGAGSGEGTLVRYSTTNGTEWTQESGCYYFLPESYYDLSTLGETYDHYGNAPIRPHGLTATVCPAYVSQLHS